jgi:hypothetical protein
VRKNLGEEAWLVGWGSQWIGRSEEAWVGRGSDCGG